MQPAYLIVEFVLALLTVGHSLLDDTISELGASTCDPTGAGTSTECAAAPLVMNAAFVVFGLLMAVGAVLLRDELGLGVWSRVAVVAWVVAGLSAAATGFVPLDLPGGAHAWAAGPTFVARPVALLASTAAVWGVRPALARMACVLGGVALTGAVCFATQLGSPTWTGGWERLAVWPVHVWLGLAGLTLVRGPRAG